MIIIGVMIALAATSWWENRTDRHREQMYARQLLTDMLETEHRLEASISGDSASLAGSARFADAADRIVYGDSSHADAPLDSIASWAAITYTSFSPVNGTYTALLQNDGIELLQNDSLRLHLINYASIVSAVQELLRQTEMQSWRNLEQVSLAQGRVLLAHSQRGSRWKQDTAAAMLRDPQLVTAVKLQRVVSENRLAALRSLQEPTARLRQLLEAQVGTNSEADGS